MDYEKLIGKMKAFINKYNDTFISEDGEMYKDLVEIFPELVESEDEKIRKELIEFVKTRLAGFPQCDKYIAWLEKQDEQKPAWSEEDEDNLTNCIEAIEACYKWGSMVNWLKSLKDRYTWKPSDEQIEALDRATWSILIDRGTLKALYNDLKKLKEV